MIFLRLRRKTERYTILARFGRWRGDWYGVFYPSLIVRSSFAQPMLKVRTEKFSVGGFLGFSF